MKKVLITGGNGLVGSRIVELLSEKYEFINLSRETGVDITDKESITKAIENSEAEIMLHAAAYTDVKGAEREKNLKEESAAWKINVTGTHYVSRACEMSNKRLMYVSTDMVVGGDHPPAGGYTEDAEPNPLSWYAKTKYEGELRVQNMRTPHVIMRIAYPYRANFAKPDFVRFFINWLREGKSINALTDRMISPTFIDDIASAVDVLIAQEKTGMYHVVGSQILSVYDAVKTIEQVFGLNSSLIGTTTRTEFLHDRAPEPFSSALNNGKISKLGVIMRPFVEGLEEVKRQIVNSKS